MTFDMQNVAGNSKVTSALTITNMSSMAIDGNLPTANDALFVTHLENELTLKLGNVGTITLQDGFAGANNKAGSAALVLGDANDVVVVSSSLGAADSRLLSLTSNAASLHLGADIYADTAGVDINSGLTLTENVTLNTNDGDIDFGSSVEGAKTLTLNAFLYE